MKRAWIIKRILFVAVLMAIGSAAGAQTTVAVLGYENLNGDPRYDYIGGMLLGLTLFDFAENEDITLVNRSDLEAVLYEQSLSLSGIIAGNTAVSEVGYLLGAKYLLKGEYVFLGADLLVTCTLITTETGEADVYRERGSGEHMVHLLNSKILSDLTGKTVNLESDQPDRSLISLNDEKPGTIKLYTHLNLAEVYLDEEFAGYSTGNQHEPLIMDNLKPGQHTVRMHLYEFGVFADYTLQFEDWQKTVTVAPGQTLIVKAEAAHISELVVDMQELLYQRKFMEDVDSDYQSYSYKSEFTDLQGTHHTIQCTLELEKKGKSVTATLTLIYDDEPFEFNLESPDGGYSSLTEDIYLVTCDITIVGNGITFTLSRNDIDYNSIIRQF